MSTSISFVRCAFDEAVGSHNDFSSARFEECTFRGARFRFTEWDAVCFMRCDLRGAMFHDGGAFNCAHFIDCDLRGAELDVLADLPPPWRSARHVVEGPADQTFMQDCKLAGARGPFARDRVSDSFHGRMVEHADISPACDGLQFATLADIVRQLS